MYTLRSGQSTQPPIRSDIGYTLYYILKNKNRLNVISVKKLVDHYGSRKLYRILMRLRQRYALQLFRLNPGRNDGLFVLLPYTIGSHPDKRRKALKDTRAAWDEATGGPQYNCDLWAAPVAPPKKKTPAGLVEAEGDIVFEEPELDDVAQ